MIYKKNESKTETDERKSKVEPIILSSTKSMKVSLQAIRSGAAGLDAHRRSMLNRVLAIGDWARFRCGTISLKDLAYLTAKTGDEFALLRGKREDVLFHGDSGRCMFDSVLSEWLITHKLVLVGHAHPAEPIPYPSNEDRQALRQIGQPRSTVISAMTGMCLEFSGDPYEMGR